MAFLADILIIALLGLFIYLGIRKGAAKSIVGICSFVITTVLFFLLKEPLQKLFLNLSFVEKWTADMASEFAAKANLEQMSALFSAAGSSAKQVADAVAGFVIGLIVFVIIFIIAMLLTRVFKGVFVKIMELPILRIVNKAAGGVIGFAKGLVIVWLVMALFMIPSVSSAAPGWYDALQNGFISGTLFSLNIFIIIFA
ncbi:MAG: CvpA family protein [Clostridia bacterium]|nr:CvpA family protein [Clostridia bacterium]